MSTLVPLKVFFDNSIPFSANRGDLAEIVRPFWTTRTPEEIYASYGDLSQWLVRVSALDAADLAAFPMHWRYYQLSFQESTAKRFAELARQAGKPLVVFAMGDRRPHVPMAEAVVFGTSLYKSRRHRAHFATPVFFRDYVQTHCRNELAVREKAAKPRVGFCGQASAPVHRLVGQNLRNMIWSIRDRTGVLSFEAPPVLSHLHLRARVLRTLSRSKEVNTNFIIRRQYRGRSSAPGEAQSSVRYAQREFIDNIINSDYTVCVRGGGNFSKRLYETLCLGRIPVFVDTDCVLPFDFAVNWQQYCIWVKKSETPQIGEKVAGFHEQLTPQGFIDLQHECRKFWQEWLTLPKFIERFALHFDGTGAEANRK